MDHGDSTLQHFKDHLVRKGLKLTQEREAIFNRVSKYKGHFNADSLYDLLKKESAGIARGTVYRTIPLLLESGAIQKSVGTGKREFFESRNKKEHHDHMVCIGCRKIIEFHSDDIEEIQDKICEKYGFEISFHDHRIFGYCKECR